MGYHPRIESDEHYDLITTRTMNSEIWLSISNEMTTNILGLIAKYKTKYQIKIQSLAIQGNHIHMTIESQMGKRAAFMRDLNSKIARDMKRFVPSYRGGKLWGRRYSNEFMPHEDDLEEKFFYVALQSVQDGLTENIEDYPGYNSFFDAIYGIAREYKFINWAKYNDAKRWDPKVSITEFTEYYILEFDRIPGYENFTQEEYAAMMLQKFNERKQVLIAKRLEEGKGFAGPEAVQNVVPGSKPRSTKTSTISSIRPRVISVCKKRLKKAEAWYLSIYYLYKEASKSYRAGNLSAAFPSGTYKPYVYSI
jgi:REP element-mobilizing transposase RayT